MEKVVTTGKAKNKFEVRAKMMEADKLMKQTILLLAEVIQTDRRGEWDAGELGKRIAEISEIRSNLYKGRNHDQR